MNIFLDDNRLPLEISWVDFDYCAANWVIVRNYTDFVSEIEKGDFEIISFDHDLDRTSTFECIRCNSSQEPFNYSKVSEKTGYHCALFLKEFCEKNNKTLPSYLIHSLNTKGRDNIINVLGTEKLLATHSLEIIFDKADEILKRRKSWREKA